jgi:hypothetical protein
MSLLNIISAIYFNTLTISVNNCFCDKRLSTLFRIGQLSNPLEFDHPDLMIEMRKIIEGRLHWCPDIPRCCADG